MHNEIAPFGPRLLASLLGLLTALPLLAEPVRAAASPATAIPTVTVFAASSLTESLQAAADDYTAATGVKVRLSFAASSVLARQIENGAAADLFLSADEDWMDYLAQHSLLDAASRRDFLGNRLVLIAPAGNALELKAVRGMALRAALGGGRLAIGDPDSVPAGKYAREALMTLGAWNEVEDRLARAENVRAALLYVSRGEAPLGIVYETDARVDRGVRIIDVFPETSHAAIRYPAAILRGATPGAAAFLNYLRGDRARTRFEAAGFQVLR